MKHKLLLIAAILFLGIQSYAQPTAITWQGKLLDASGNAITQNNVAMTFAIFDASTAGNQLWPASGVVAKVVNIVNGLYSVQLGTGTGDDIAFTAAMFDGNTPWLEVKVGTETLPRAEITNVPFALISNDLSATGWENPGEIGKTNPNTGKFTSVETGTLKVTNGASAGKVLTSDVDGNASWTTPYTGLANFTESNFTFDSRPGVKFTPNNAATDVDLVLQPKRYAAIIAQQPDGTNIGGNKRGFQATDFQRFRTNASQVASGQYATIVGGTSNTASGTTSTAMGSGARATGTNSIAIGSGVTASGYIATAMGDLTTSSGRNSTTMGYYTHALSAYETVIGLNSTTYTPVSDWTWEPADRLFVVGNGYSSEALSNALTILKNANTTIGGSLTLNGNRTDSSYVFPIYRGTSGQVLATDGAGNTSWSSLGNQWTSSGSNIYYNSGNVGIGTTTPLSKLAFGDNIGTGFDDWADYQILLFGAETPQASYGLGIKANTLAFNSNSDYDFDQNGSTVVTIQSGKVGIGTEAPTQKLEVNGSTLIPSGQSYWIGNAGDTGNRLRLHQSGVNAYIDWGEEMLFLRSGATSVTTRVVIDGNGRVGIGTDQPKASLDLSNISSNRKIALNTAADNDHQFTGFGFNGDALRYQVSGTTDSHVFYSGTSTSTSGELFRIKGTGEVVIPALTTQGILQNNASGVLSSTKGTGNQVLKMNSAGTATEWGSETDPRVPSGTAPGQMQYWDGTAWVTVAAGKGGQTLIFTNGSPLWVYEYDIINHLSVGDYYQGGIIAYFLQSGDPGYYANVRHGIIAAPTDQSTSSTWGCYGTSISGADGTALLTGAQNTTDIVAGCSDAGIAARICNDLVLNGYSDWYLPSKDELNKLYLNRIAIGSFASAWYWSSSENSSVRAWTQYFDTGYQMGDFKNWATYVRAIRTF